MNKLGVATFPYAEYRTRLRRVPYLGVNLPMPDTRIAAAVAKTNEKDRKYRSAQLHAAPVSFAFTSPQTPVGQGVVFNAIGALYTAEATQIITLIRFSAVLFNAFATTLTAFVSKVTNTTSIANGIGGDVVVTQAKSINGIQKVEGNEVYPPDIEAPQSHYLNAGESLAFGVLSTYNSPMGQLFGPTIFFESVVKYELSERGFV